MFSRPFYPGDEIRARDLNRVAFRANLALVVSLALAAGGVVLHLFRG